MITSPEGPEPGATENSSSIGAATTRSPRAAGHRAAALITRRQMTNLGDTNAA